MAFYLSIFLQGVLRSVVYMLFFFCLSLSFSSLPAGRLYKREAAAQSVVMTLNGSGEGTGLRFLSFLPLSGKKETCWDFNGLRVFFSRLLSSGGTLKSSGSS